VQEQLTAAEPEPPAECPLCPRLAAFRQQWRTAEPGWHNAPVPTFGSLDARFLIVGLAPGLRGANRTGRPFTGDYAGDLLYRSLLGAGFAEGRYLARPDDGLRLVDAAISNAVRCVPPENKPTPAEIRTCRTFLDATVAAMPNLRAVLALGKIAHDSVATVLGLKPSKAKFAHGARHAAGLATLFDSYHCSRLNTNTGRLTEAMFVNVIDDIRRHLGAAA
jgi:uracil-DNA glycosylase family 4